MNKFIRAITELNLTAVDELIQKEQKWLTWAEDSGKNSLHYLCGVKIANDPLKVKESLQILKLLLKKGMDINSIHLIKDDCGFFPAMPLWYAYTRGRNETLFNHLLENGADPEHCMFAIAWYDDAASAALFKKYGAKIDDISGGNTPFLAAWNWRKLNVAEWFLKNGADVNFSDPDGNTALYFAVKRKYKIEEVKLLLKFGADFNKQNNQGVSPRKLCELNKQRKILSLFETH